ncbi:MAG TPA: DNA-binding protein, partial [Chitinophagaceae bacterium]|nr:DNA-binding protein [Chitinophagaceae bacterium]
YSKRIRAGKRRTYFFDVKATRGNDYYLTITESRKRFDSDGYDRHKVFLYKEDFNKFLKALNEAVAYVKTELMPDFDFDAFNHEYAENEEEQSETSAAATVIDINTDNNYATAVAQTNNGFSDLSSEAVDKW